MRPQPSNQLHPRVKMAWRIVKTMDVAILGVVAAASIAPLYIFDIDLELARTLALITAGILACLLVVWVGIAPALRYKYWRYEVGPHELDIQRGIIWRKRFIIPFVRVQNTDTRQGPLLRVLGLASVAVSTAAGTHEIPGLSFEEADNLRDLIAEQARLAQEDV